MVLFGKNKVILSSVVRLVCKYKVIPKDTGGRTDGFTSDCWENGRCYCGRVLARVVERVVLPWSHGSTSGCINFWGRHVF